MGGSKALDIILAVPLAIGLVVVATELCISHHCRAHLRALQMAILDAEGFMFGQVKRLVVLALPEAYMYSVLGSICMRYPSTSLSLSSSVKWQFSSLVGE
eukprot:616190-Ditylum_brightwellii.AAC.1